MEYQHGLYSTRLGKMSGLSKYRCHGRMPSSHALKTCLSLWSLCKGISAGMRNHVHLQRFTIAVMTSHK